MQINTKNPITRIVGTHSYFKSECGYGITYLEFSGTMNSYGSFGEKAGDFFTFEPDSSGFTGFHGKATDNQICALGVYVNSSATRYLKSPKKKN